MPIAGIALGTGLGGGTAATSSGAPGGGGAFSNVNSVSFDGADDYAITGSAVTELNAAANLTVSCWVKTSSLTQSAFLFGNRSVSSTGMALQTHTNSRFYFYFSGGYVYWPTTSFSADTWFNLVLAYDGSQADADKLKVYRDGSLVSYTGSLTATSMAASTATFWVGRDQLVTNAWGGNIDEFAVIPSTLSPSDVTSLYNSGTPASLTAHSPLIWWRMGENDGGAGTTITDLGSASKDLSLVNGATITTDVP